MDEPLRVCLICCQVLAATGDMRAADYLHTASALLQDRAARITNMEWRAAYRAIVVHRSIEALAAST